MLYVTYRERKPADSLSFCLRTVLTTVVMMALGFISMMCVSLNDETLRNLMQLFGMFLGVYGVYILGLSMISAFIARQIFRLAQWASLLWVDAVSICGAAILARQMLWFNFGL